MKKYTTRQIAEAIFTVNKHAKTALNPRELYYLKKLTIDKLLQEKRAQKKGLQYSKNSGVAQQASSLLIECSGYFFHTKARKADFATLTHLGYQDENYRNPPSSINLRTARTILTDYIGTSGKPNAASVTKQQAPIPPVFTKLGDGQLTLPTQSFKKRS